MEHLYIPIGFLIIGAILYKCTNSAIVNYCGYSFWWAGWGWLTSWLITLIFDVEFSRLLVVSVLLVLMAAYNACKSIFIYLKKK